jgi:hypothetical protein
MTLMAARHTFRTIADDDTPKGVSIPDSWAGILMWALGRHGPVVLFVAATWFLYQDNKAQQAAILEVAKAQISINAQVVVQLADLKTSILALTDEARKAHAKL